MSNLDISMDIFLTIGIFHIFDLNNYKYINRASIYSNIFVFYLIEHKCTSELKSYSRLPATFSLK